MSRAHIRASLVDALQGWLDCEADTIGAVTGLWQDTTEAKRNAEIYAAAVMACIDSASLQTELDQELGG